MAFFHVDDVTFMQESVEQGCGEVFVVQESVPLAKAEVGGEQGAALVMTVLNQGKEVADLLGLGFDVADFINEQDVIATEVFDDFRLTVVRLCLLKLIDQCGEVDVASAVAVLDGLHQEAGGQACFSTAGGTDPDNVLVLVDKTEVVVESLDFCPGEFGLLCKGVGLQNVMYGHLGVFDAPLQGVFLFVVVFFFDDAFQQFLCAESLGICFFDAVLPVLPQVAQAEVAQLFE